MLSLFSPLHSIAARRGDGLRHELVALLKNQESNSKKRISTSPACELEMARQKVGTPSFTEPRGPKMSREQYNKAIVGRWFEGFWGNPWNPNIIDELAAPDVLLQYSLHAPRRGREDVRNFMMDFRAAFPDLKFWGAADLIAEGDVVGGRGRVAARTPALRLVISSWARCRQLRGARCVSPVQRCSVSKMARSPRKLASTMASLRFSSLES
jgi:hypothetical protein